MADNEKSSSLAATAKGTAPSTYRKYSSFPPIFQAPDQQTEEEMRLGLLYDEGNQGEVYNPESRRNMWDAEKRLKSAEKALAHEDEREEQAKRVRLQEREDKAARRAGGRVKYGADADKQYE